MYAKMMKMERNVIIVSIDLTVKQAIKVKPIRHVVPGRSRVSYSPRELKAIRTSMPRTRHPYRGMGVYNLSGNTKTEQVEACWPQEEMQKSICGGFNQPWSLEC